MAVAPNAANAAGYMTRVESEVCSGVPAVYMTYILDRIWCHPMKLPPFDRAPRLMVGNQGWLGG